MDTLIAELYESLTKAADSEENARRAADCVAACEKKLAKFDFHFALLTGMVAVNILATLVLIFLVMRR